MLHCAFARRVALIATCLTITTGAAQAASVTLDFTGYIDATGAAAFLDAPTIQPGDLFSLSLRIETDTPPYSTSSDATGEQAEYRQAITALSLSIGGLSFGLQTQPFSPDAPNQVMLGNQSSDMMQIDAPLSGPDQGGLGVTSLSLLFLGTDKAFDSIALDATRAVGFARNSTWAGRTISFGFGPFDAPPTAWIDGQIVDVSIPPIPLPASLALLPMALLGFGFLRSKRPA